MNRFTALFESLEPRRLLAGTSSISGSLFWDLDRDGVRDATERPAANSVGVGIDSNNDGVVELGEPLSHADYLGEFKFEGLEAGTYVLDSNGYQLAPTTPRRGRVAITIADGEARTGVVFGMTSVVTISGKVVRDYDGDGVEYGGNAIANRIVYADINHDGAFDKTIDRYTRSNVEGNYELNVYAGAYELRTTLLKGESQTAPGKGRPLRVSINPRGSAREKNLLVSQPATQSIFGWTFDDLDGNGKIDRTDIIRPSLTVFIDRNDNERYDKGEPRQLTDITGKYRFSGLYSIEYDVGVVMPGGRRIEGGPIATGTPGRHPWNFALITTSKFTGTVARPIPNYFDDGVVGMSVYIDLNDDGTRQADEPSDITNDFGEWDIIVPTAGTYTIRVVARPGTTFSDPATGVRKVGIGPFAVKAVPKFLVQT